jgi:anti-anti-sigma regulatory factor
MAVEGMTVTRAIAVAELDDMHWIRVRAADLDLDASREIRQACLHALERGVTDIVIELTGVVHVCAEGIDALEAAADELGAKHGTLTLVVKHDETVGRIELRHVPATGLAAVTGLGGALDEAILGSGRAQPSAPETSGGGETDDH